MHAGHTYARNVGRETDACTRTRVRAHDCVGRSTHMRCCKPTQAHAYIHAYTYMHTDTHTNAHAHAQMHTQMHTCTHAHAH